MNKCFVIQPFDNDKYEQRYIDTFEPAIKNAGLDPYRIDKDLSVRILIEDIEKGISEAEICFAEISTNNPNVWYELGFAFACGKDVIMVSCLDERHDGKFPFDISHKQIITYKSNSLSDFKTLEENITGKIKLFQEKSKTVLKLNSTPVVEIQGLKSHEIAILILLMESQFTQYDYSSIYTIKDEMGKAGYTNIATNIGLRSLIANGMIKNYDIPDEFNDNTYNVWGLTEKGVNWVMANQDILQFRKTQIDSNSNDLPF